LDLSRSMNKGTRKSDGHKFISELAEIANFTQNGSHGALTVFSEPFWLKPDEMLQIKFSEQLDLDAYLEAVNRTIRLVRTWPGTDIINGLNVSLNKMFQTNSGMRQDALQVAVLITDGNDTNPASAYEAMADMYNEKKIKVLAVGVADAAPEKLSKLVESPEHCFQAQKFEDLLDSISKIIGALICEGIISQL